MHQGRRWSQARLARELQKVGLTLGQPDVARLEKQGDEGKRPRSVTVEDVYALALALDCPPLALLKPEGPEPVLVGAQGESGERLVAWFVGATPLNTVRDPDVYRSHGRPDLKRTGAPGLGPFLRDIAAQLDSEDPPGQERVILAATDYLKGALKGVRLRSPKSPDANTTQDD